MRICAFSDLHGVLPVLPDADLYLCAGDICPNFHARDRAHQADLQLKWFKENWIPWRGDRTIHFTLGNHDYLDPSRLADCLIDDLVYAEGLAIWFTPWSNLFGCGWAWMREPDGLRPIYEAIPDGIELIVTHGPPYGYGDMVEAQSWYPRYPLEDPHLGNRDLMQAIVRIKPEIVICGHIHTGHGEYRLNIDDGSGLDPNEWQTTIYNVSLVNESLQPVYAPTIIEVE